MKLDFDPAHHEYKLDGRFVPSVTKVLEPLDLLDGIPLPTLQAAGELGRRVHEAVGMLMKRVLEWRTLDTALVPYCQAAQKFCDETGFKVLRVESRMGDPELRFAGTLDLMGVLQGKTSIIDWKSSSVMPRTVALQTAAYDHLHRRNLGGRPMQRYGVQLLPNGQYRVWHYEDTRDWNWFVSALNVWWFRHTVYRRLLPAEGWKLEEEG